MAKPLVALEDAQRFLESHHGRGVAEVERIAGGYWSSAFSYVHDGAELVVRFGHDRGWYEVDRDAFANRSDELPVPRVVEIGDAFESVFFAISERAHGVYFEDTPLGRAEPLVRAVLGALRAAPEAEVDYTWRGWLFGGLDHAGRNGQWRAAVACDDFAGPIAERAEAAIHSLLDACPERRDLVHGDLVHKNVLVAPDYSRVTAVYSWKCSARGDALFDAAWLAFWGPWFPGIGAVDVWSIADDGSSDAATRFHCYQLHIGATHLCWHAQIGDADGLHRVARRLDELLEGGS